MRKTLLAALLLFAAHSQAASFAGSWAIDKGQSTDLPPFYVDVKTHSLNITQDAQKLDVSIEITSDAHEPLRNTYHYTLDGIAAKTETQVRTPDGLKNIPTTLTATPEKDALKITIERELPLPNGETMKGKTSETWHLSEDGKSLIIDRVDESRRGTMSSKLVFTKQ